MCARKDSHEIEKQLLVKKGFNFDFHTHFKQTRNGNYTYIFCFDYGYREVKDWKDKKDRYKIVKAFKEIED